MIIMILILKNQEFDEFQVNLSEMKIYENTTNIQL